MSSRQTKLLYYYSLINHYNKQNLIILNQSRRYHSLFKQQRVSNCCDDVRWIFLNNRKNYHYYCCDSSKSSSSAFVLSSQRNMALNPNQVASFASKSDHQAPSSSSSSTTPTTTKPKYSATKEELKARLSPIQYQVTQLKSTERPFSGEYNKFNKKGTYHCVVCDEELFSSNTKFESGCGWPAFFDSIDKSRLKFVKDYDLIGAGNLLRLAKNPDLIRTEVLCQNCNAHLGHRFDDGPSSKGGKRYCINSAALRFEPNPNSSNNDGG